jgi:mono/diheme cytochrome c family protein
LASGCAKRDQPSSAPAIAAGPPIVSGEAVYAEHCAVCHMADGSGVPNMQPALIGSAIVAGDRRMLEAVVRAGSAALRSRQSEFGNEMPPFGFLTDAEVDAVIAHLQTRFGAGAR